jgi:hypothetical protein
MQTSSFHRLLAVLVVVTAAGNAGAGVGFSKIADDSTPVPNQPGNFLSFSIPAISGNTVAFESGSHDADGIYTGTVGTVGAVRVTDSSTAQPGQSGNFEIFNSPSISGSTVAFEGSSVAGLGGIYTGTAGTTGAARVADTSTAVPSQSGNFTNAFGNPAVSNNTVAFGGKYSGGQGIYTGTAGTTGASRVADTSTAVPNQAGNFVGFGSPAISGNTVAFEGGYSSGQGIYTGTAGTSGAVRLADTSTPVPNQPAGNFLSFSSSPAISGNTVAFGAESHSTDGIYTGTVGGTNLSVVADGSPPCRAKASTSPGSVRCR